MRATITMQARYGKTAQQRAIEVYRNAYGSNPVFATPNADKETATLTFQINQAFTSQHPACRYVAENADKYSLTE